MSWCEGEEVCSGVRGRCAPVSINNVHSLALYDSRVFALAET